MVMQACPACGAPNSVKRAGCYECEAVLRDEAEIRAAETASRQRKIDTISYVAAAIAVVWIASVSLDAFVETAVLAAVMIGVGVAALVRRAFQDAFPERNTGLLRFIVTLPAAWFAWQIAVALRY